MPSALDALERSALPVWLLDAERMRITWANQAAADLWRAESREDLLARDLSGAPASVIARTSALLARVRAGETVVEEWTLYPKGVPTPVRLHLTGAPLEDGRIGLLNQALPTETGVNPTLLRGIEALHHVSVIVALVSERGAILMQNAAALRAFGTRERWPDWFADPATATDLLGRAGRGPVTRTLVFATLEGERTHSVYAHATKDPVSGEPAVLVHHADETDRVRAEEKADEHREIAERLQATLALVEKQRNDILTLSAPILDVGSRTIAMPIIGDVDDARTQDLTERLLLEIQARGAAHVILDLTSAVVSDEGSAARLLQMVGSVRLLGARAVITGVQPSLATHLVAVGFSDRDVTIARSLAHGLAASRGDTRL